MSSTGTPNIYTYIADGSIAKGKAVKIGSARTNVAIGAANTDSCFGIAQVEATSSGKQIEVARCGPAKGLAGETITAGKYLVAHTDGSLVKANASADRLVAVALEDASSGDLFEVEVIQGFAVAAE